MLGSETRLLTVTGPPGVGKTRLALALAERVPDHHEDGVVFVDLGPLRHARSVPSAIGRALGIQETAGQPLPKALERALADRRLLLLLDNFEHLVSAGPRMADLLASCPRLKILVASRAPLHVRWERLFPISPLRCPGPDERRGVRALADVPAVALFVARARAVDPEFVLDAGNARAVADLCVHLDGLPLAIELAAARVATLPPRAMLDRLAGSGGASVWPC